MRFKLTDEMIQEFILGGMTDDWSGVEPLDKYEAAERIDYLMNVFLKSDVMKKAFESWLNLKFGRLLYGRLKNWTSEDALTKPKRTFK